MVAGSDKRMCVVHRFTNYEGLEAVSRDPTQKCPQLGLNFRSDPLATSLAGKVAMNEAGNLCVWHPVFQASLRDLNIDRKSTRLNSSHRCISYAVFCLKKKS